MLLRGLPHDGVRAFARSYLHEESFVGRSAERGRLLSFVQGTDERALLCAPAGRGKSALVLRWAEGLDAGGHLVAWVPVSRRFGTYRSSTIDELLSSRLRLLLGTKGGWRELVAGHEGAPLLVVIDALDELQDGDLLDSLRGLTLGPSVKVLVTARPELELDADAWAALLGWGPCAMLTLGPLSTGEVAEWLTGSASERGGSVREVMRHSGGDPLLVRVCKDALDQGVALPDARDPADLVGAWWAEQRTGLRAAEDVVAERTLASLGEARGVVPWSVLAAVVGEAESEVRQVLRLFDRFVVEVPGRGVSFAHPRFNEIARWTYPEATQHAQQRFAGLTLEARQTNSPDAYFLHFGLAHLEAAGVPEEQLLTLASYTSTLAWLQVEGSAYGHLNEVTSLLRRSARWLDRVWGTDAMSEALRAQAYLVHTAMLLKTEVRETGADFLVELVRHGLRTPAQAVQWASNKLANGDGNLSSALERLLPLLPDGELGGFVDLCLQHPSIVSAVLPRLVKAGLWEDFFECLQASAGWIFQILPFWRELPAPQLERLRQLVNRQMTGEMRSVLEVEWLPLLDPAQQQEILPRLIHEHRDPSTLGRLMEVAASLGQGALVLQLLRQWQSSEQGFPREGRDAPMVGVWGAILRVLPKLQGEERAEAMAIGADLLRRYPLTDDEHWNVLHQVPTDFPGYDALLEPHWADFERSPWMWGSMLRKGFPTPMQERDSAIVLRWLARWVEAQEASRRDGADSGSNKADGDAPVEMPPFSLYNKVNLVEPDRLLPLLERAFALRTARPPLARRDVHELLALLVTNASTEATRERVRELIAQGILPADSWLWTFRPDWWTTILEPSRRIELLRQHMHASTDASDRTGELETALVQLDPMHERDAASRLVSLLEHLLGDAAVSSALLAPAHRAQLPDEALREAARQWLAGLLAKIPFVRLMSFEALLRTGDPRLDTPGLSASLLEALTPDNLPWSPDEAEALARVPAADRHAWRQRCCPLPEDEATDLMSWTRSDARWLPGELDALVPSPPMRHPELVPPRERDPRKKLAPESPLRDRQALSWLRRLPTRFHGELAKHEGLVLTALRVADPAALLEVSARCLALDTYPIRDQVRSRAMHLLYRSESHRNELEELLALLMPPAPVGDLDWYYLWESDPLAWFWHQRSAPIEQRSDYPLPAPEAVSLGLQEHLAHLLCEGKSRNMDFLYVAFRLWESLSPGGRQSVRLRLAKELLDHSPWGRPPHWTVLDWALAEVDEATRRQVWLREMVVVRDEVAFPLATLRLLGGPAAVAAWTAGVVDALDISPNRETPADAPLPA